MGRSVWHINDFPKPKSICFIEYKGNYFVWHYMGYWMELGNPGERPDKWAYIDDVTESIEHRESNIIKRICKSLMNLRVSLRPTSSRG